MITPTRRDFLKTLGCSALTLTAGCASIAGGRSARRPNIVYIMADDLGYGDVGCNNPDSKIPTPSIDRLAAEGVRFTDAHTGSAVCTPTRYGLLTGRYCWRTSLKKGVLWGYSPPLIEPDRLTVASLLKQQGYATACVGKWHLGLGWAYKNEDGDDDEKRVVDYDKPIAGGPLALGFDYFFGIPASLDMVPYVYVENDRVLAAPTEHIEKRGGLAFYRGGPIAPGFKHEEVLDVLTRKAVDFVDRHDRSGSDAPFFLYFPLPAPHTPVLPTEPFEGRSRAGEYGDFVSQVDWTIGQVTKALKRTGELDNTLFIVTSDNGSTMKPMKEYDHLPNHNLRGRKSDVWDGGHRVLFVARWPGVVEPGTTSGGTICHTDLLATCAEIVGSAVPRSAGEDSVSFLPALRGDPRAARETAVVHHSISGLFAIREGKWKLIDGKGSGGWTKGGKDDPAPGQLYDMENDIGETRNLYAEHPDVAARLSALLEKYKAASRSAP